MIFSLKKLLFESKGLSTLIDLDSFSVGRNIKLEIIHHDTSVDVILCNHTYNETQIEWFKAGSALNLIRLAQ